MLEKTRGIVLHHVRYGETSMVAHIYTENRGRQSFIFKGVRSPRSKTRSNVLQPLFILNIEAYFKETRDLHIVKEVSLHKIMSFPYDLNKSAQAMFIAEILYKALKEESGNPELFTFLLNSIEYFELSEAGSVNFHIFFLIKLMRFLGILPSTRETREVLYFDMKEGDYHSVIPGHDEYLEPFQTRFLQYLLNAGYPDLYRLKMNRHDRQIILDRILRFYSLHMAGMDHLKSFEVLKDTFS